MRAVVQLTESPDAGLRQLRAIGASVLEVIRRVVVTRRANGDVPSLPPARLPVLGPSTPLGLLVAIAIPEAAGHLLGVLAAAELQRDVHRALQRFASDEDGVGISIEAVVAVAGELGIGELAALGALAPGGALARRGLIEFMDDDGPLFTRRVTVPDRVLGHLLGELDGPATDLPFEREPARAASELCVAGDPAAPPLLDRLRRLLPRVDQQALWIVGSRGSGRRTVLAAVAAEQGLTTLCLDHRAIAHEPLSELVPILWREVLIEGAIVCVHGVEHISDAPSPAELLAGLQAAALPIVFTSTEAPALGDFDHAPTLLELGPPAQEDMRALWRRALPTCPDVDVLSARYRLTPGRVLRIADAARAAADLDGREVGTADVRRAITQAMGTRVAALGTRVDDQQTWEDVVLPEDTLDAVCEMIARVQCRHQVLEEWGFQRKVAKGTGVVSLFSGPPGTGKSMVAGLVARELGLDLYQIDLSRVVSKWVGETEKNLAQVFDSAEGAAVMLLFDEADSLFGKRTEVKSAHDRHANTEVNYLLQRIERFDGVCILTTNLESSIDDAFRRRLAFRIHFPMPDASERLWLWQRMIPREAKLAAGVDFTALAERHELSGGRIRNAVLRAAFLAAGEGVAIGMQHLERAIAREFRDAGALTAHGRLS